MWKRRVPRCICSLHSPFSVDRSHVRRQPIHRQSIALGSQSVNNFAMPVGSIVEVVLLSLALADRINQFK